MEDRVCSILCNRASRLASWSFVGDCWRSCAFWLSPFVARESIRDCSSANCAEDTWEFAPASFAVPGTGTVR